MRTTTLEAAVAAIPDGASLMIGGVMAVGTPERRVVPPQVPQMQL